MRLLRPWKTARSVIEISIDEIKENDIKLMIFDFDNTLARHKSIKLDKNIVEHLDHIKNSGLDVYILSNAKKDRIEKVLFDLDLEGEGMALKPFPFAINRKVKASGLNKKNVVFVGDQLFTDVIAGNLAGIKTILVDKLDEQESKFISMRRKLEEKILRGAKR